jgi:CRISPR-associated protein Cas2
MTFCVIILQAVNLSIRGEVNRWLQEVDSGIFVGSLSRLLRDKIWGYIKQRVKKGRAMIISQDNSEIGYSIELHNYTDRVVRDFDGIPLISLISQPLFCGASLPSPSIPRPLSHPFCFDSLQSSDSNLDTPQVSQGHGVIETNSMDNNREPTHSKERAVEQQNSINRASLQRRTECSPVEKLTNDSLSVSEIIDALIFDWDQQMDSTLSAQLPFELISPNEDIISKINTILASPDHQYDPFNSAERIATPTPELNEISSPTEHLNKIQSHPMIQLQISSQLTQNPHTMPNNTQNPQTKDKQSQNPHIYPNNTPSSQLTANSIQAQKNPGFPQQEIKVPSLPTIKPSMPLLSHSNGESRTKKKSNISPKKTDPKPIVYTNKPSIACNLFQPISKDLCMPLNIIERGFTCTLSTSQPSVQWFGKIAPKME